MFRLKNAIVIAAIATGIVLVARFTQIGARLEAGLAWASPVLALPCSSDDWVVEEGPSGMLVPRPECWDFSGDPADVTCVTGDTQSSALPILIARYDYQDDESKGSLLLELGTQPEAMTDPTWAWNGWEALAYRRIQAGKNGHLVTLEYLMFGHDGCVLVETGYDGRFDHTALDRSLNQSVEELLERMANANDSRRKFGVGNAYAEGDDFHHWLGLQRMSYFQAVTGHALEPEEESSEDEHGPDEPQDDGERLMASL